MSAQPMPEPAEDLVTQALPAVAPVPDPVPAESGQSVRTPLSVVPQRRVKRRRAPFVLLCVLIVAAVVAIVLSMNIKVAGTQYDLVRIHAQSQDLQQSNQAKDQELDYRRAPQNLYAKAEKAGMVAAGRPGVVDLKRKRVTAKASAPGIGPDGKKVVAKKDEKEAPTLTVPMSPEQLAALAAKKQAAIRARQEAKAEELQAKASASSGTSSSGTASSGKTAEPATAGGTKTDQKTSPDTAKPAQKQDPEPTGADNGNVDKDGAARGFTPAQLNGGTIPAPTTD